MRKKIWGGVFFLSALGIVIALISLWNYAEDPRSPRVETAFVAGEATSISPSQAEFRIRLQVEALHGDIAVLVDEVKFDVDYDGRNADDSATFTVIGDIQPVSQETFVIKAGETVEFILVVVVITDEPGDTIESGEVRLARLGWSPTSGKSIHIEFLDGFTATLTAIPPKTST